jgi:hypothetical protein
METKITKYAIYINKKNIQKYQSEKTQKNSNITTRYKKKIKH